MYHYLNGNENLEGTMRGVMRPTGFAFFSEIPGINRKKHRFEKVVWQRAHVRKTADKAALQWKGFRGPVGVTADFKSNEWQDEKTGPWEEWQPFYV